MNGNGGIDLEAQPDSPPLISSTVTLSKGSKPAAPPTTTASWLFLDKTNMVELRFHG